MGLLTLIQLIQVVLYGFFVGFILILIQLQQMWNSRRWESNVTYSSARRKLLLRSELGDFAIKKYNFPLFSFYKSKGPLKKLTWQESPFLVGSIHLHSWNFTMAASCFWCFFQYGADKSPSQNYPYTTTCHEISSVKCDPGPLNRPNASVHKMCESSRWKLIVGLVVPSRERQHIPPRERQIIDSEVLAGRGYVTSKEGFWRIVGQAMKKIEKFETSKTFCQCIGSNFLCGHGCRKGFQEGAEGHAFLRGLRMHSLS